MSYSQNHISALYLQHHIPASYSEYHIPAYLYSETSNNLKTLLDAHICLIYAYPFYLFCSANINAICIN